MNLTNKSIGISIKQNGKTIKNITRVNRILDNYLNYMVYRSIPGGSDYTNADLWDVTTPFLYINYSNTNTITDSSTTMLYNLKVEMARKPSTIEVDNNLITATYFWSTSFSLGASEITLKDLGFGLDNSDVTKWLLAYVNIEDVGLTLTGTIDVDFSRIDVFEMKGTLIAGSTIDYPLHMLGNQFFYLSDPTDRLTSELSAIGFTRDPQFRDAQIDWYAIGDLTVAYENGKAEITGFDPFVNTDTTPLYPKTGLYPSAGLYPTAGPQYLYVIYKYDVDRVGNIIDSYYYYHNLNTSGNGTIQIDYIFERSDN